MASFRHPGYTISIGPYITFGPRARCGRASLNILGRTSSRPPSSCWCLPGTRSSLWWGCRGSPSRSRFRPSCAGRMRRRWPFDADPGWWKVCRRLMLRALGHYELVDSRTRCPMLLESHQFFLRLGYPRPLLDVNDRKAFYSHNY